MVAVEDDASFVCSRYTREGGEYRYFPQEYVDCLNNALKLIIKDNNYTEISKTYLKDNYAGEKFLRLLGIMLNIE